MDKYHVAAVFTAIVISFLISFLIQVVMKNRVTDDDLIQARQILRKKEKEQKEKKYKKIFFRKRSSYEDKMMELSKLGVNYHIGRNISPSEYLMIQFGCGVLLGVAGVFMVGPLGCLAALLGYVLPTAFFRYQNERDNEKMLSDIKTIYDTMIVSMEAGVFLTEAIADCYQQVEHKRLKKALLELNSELIATNQIEESVNKFEMKFSNDYISNLCVILRQAGESGMSVNMLSDMAKHMTDVSGALNIKKQKKLDGEGVKIEIMLYIGIIAVCLYVTLATFGSTLNELF